MDRLVRVPVQVFPVLPFVGPSVEGALVNLSAGGMALLLNIEATGTRFTRRARLSVHFRLPGLPLTECRAVITHVVPVRGSAWLRLGIKFVRTPGSLADRIQRMVFDDQACDARMTETDLPRCELSCSFHSLCSKPIRSSNGAVSTGQFEISLQRAAR